LKPDSVGRSVGLLASVNCVSTPNGLLNRIVVMGIGSVSGAVCEGILRSALAAGVMQIFIENLLVVLKKGRGGAAPPFGLPEIFLKQRQPEQEKSVGAHFSYCANLGLGR
jgi:hypothetical protein